MVQSDGPANADDHSHQNRREVVFVLRLYAGDAGWRGQVHRLDVGSLRHVANQSELFAILTCEWDLDYNAHSGYRHPPQE